MLPSFILASASPRRRDILQKGGFAFAVIVSNVEENHPPEAVPAQIALHLAELKARSVAKDYPTQWVIGADTIVVLNNEILGKPHTRKNALAMLQKLNNQTHKVITAVCLINHAQNYARSFTETSWVTFKDNSLASLEAYAATDEPLDKAGAYAIQGEGGQLIDHIAGDLDNIIGFPLARFMEYCRSLNG